MMWGKASHEEENTNLQKACQEAGRQETMCPFGRTYMTYMVIRFDDQVLMSERLACKRAIGVDGGGMVSQQNLMLFLIA